jgi:type I restriction enzyme S subunit
MNINKTTYKDSPLGKIPNDWEMISILELAVKKKELFDDGDWVEAEFLTDEGIRLIQTGNIGEGEFIEKEKKKYISEESFYKLKCKQLRIGDILICRLAEPAGRACILPNIGEKKMITSVDVSIFRPKEELVDRNYLVAAFSTDNWFNDIRERCGGSTRTRISRGELGKIKISLPPLPEQKAIAHILGLMDTAINKNNQLIANKELQKKWLMQNLLIGKRRLKGFSGEWKIVHISDVSKEVSIKNKGDKALTVLSCTKYDGLVPSLEYFGRKIFSDNLSTYKVVAKNHFAYATNHIEEGSIGYQDKLDEALISPMYTVFKTDSSINDIFFFKLLKSYRYIYEFQTRMEGSIDRRGGLRWDAFSIIKISLPSLEEQTAIAQVLEAADKEIQILKTKTEKLRDQKKGLMQVLLTGKKRLIFK